MSPDFDEFCAAYEADDNEWWMLSSGDMQNLFDEALSRLEDRDGEIERLRFKLTDHGIQPDGIVDT